MVESGDRIEYFKPLEHSSICSLLFHSPIRLYSSDLKSWRRITASPLFSELSSIDFTSYCLSPKPQPILSYSEGFRRNLQSDNCNAGFGDEVDCRDRQCGYVRDTGECNDECTFYSEIALGGTPLSTVELPSFIGDYDTCHTTCREEPACTGFTHVLGTIEFCLLWEAWTSESYTPSGNSAMCVVPFTPTEPPTTTPSAAPTSDMPSNLPSITCTIDGINEEDCRARGCAYDYNDGSCRNECILELNTIVSGEPASDPYESVANLEECEEHCLSIADCVSSYYNGRTGCFLWSTVNSKFYSDTSTTIHCVNTASPTRTPSLSPSTVPSRSPSLSCSAFTDADECRQNECAYSDEEQLCFDTCVLYPNRELVGLPYEGGVSIKNNVEECEYACRSSDTCNMFMYKTPFCQLYVEYDAIETGTATSGMCTCRLTRAPSEFPSTTPSLAPTKRECEGLDEQACALERCAYNAETGECSPNCHLEDDLAFVGDLVTDLDSGPTIPGSTIEECEYACLILSDQCLFFYHASSICFLFQSYTNVLAQDGSTAGFCLYTASPTPAPTVAPTTDSPSTSPSNMPTKSPSKSPSVNPTTAPSISPSFTSPSGSPSKSPSFSPSTDDPSAVPTVTPSKGPTFTQPSRPPSVDPSTSPSLPPSISSPSQCPSESPNNFPSPGPTASLPTVIPTDLPSANPTLNPSGSPSKMPTSVCTTIAASNAIGCRASGCAYDITNAICSQDALREEDIYVSSSVSLPIVSQEVDIDGCERACLDHPECVVASYTQGFCQQWSDYSVKITQLGTTTIYTVISAAPTQSPSLSPNTSPSLSPSISCDRNTDEDSCRGQGCSWNRLDLSCSNFCATPENDVAFFGAPVATDHVVEVTFVLDCETLCISDPTCKMYTVILSLCYRFTSYLTQYDFPGAFSAFCLLDFSPSTSPSFLPSLIPTDLPTSDSPTNLPTETPSTTLPSSFPVSTQPSKEPSSRNCENFNNTNAEACRSNGCHWNALSGICEYGCALKTNTFIRGEYYDALDVSIDECERLCLFESNCAGFAHLADKCFLYTSWDETLDFPLAAVGICLSTSAPTDCPSVIPTASPSKSPSTEPTNSPSVEPTVGPSLSPSNAPTTSPSLRPSTDPTTCPSTGPSFSAPTVSPSVSPSSSPSNLPTVMPSDVPTTNPSTSPSLSPSLSPSNSPTVTPSVGPSDTPSFTQPSCSPSVSPSLEPSISPVTSQPSIPPTEFPSFAPTETCITLYFNCGTLFDGEYAMDETSTAADRIWRSDDDKFLISSPFTPYTLFSGQRWVFSLDDTNRFLISGNTVETMGPPGSIPDGEGFWFDVDDNLQILGEITCPANSIYCSSTWSPTVSPSNSPSHNPSVIPTFNPSVGPSTSPSFSPSVGPTSSPSFSPSVDPTTDSPSISPSFNPSVIPSTSPSNSPSVDPSCSPSVDPSSSPSVSPSISPSFSPSVDPTTDLPTVDPSLAPTESPTDAPTNPCTTLHFSCGTEFDGEYNAVDFYNPVEWISHNGGSKDTLLFAIDWPEELQNRSLSGLHWAFQYVEGTRLLISEGFEDDFPRGAETWLMVDLVHLEVTDEIECPEESIVCTYTPFPSSTPTTTPSDVPSVLPTSAPSPMPSLAPTESPTELPTATCALLDFTCNTLYDGFYRLLDGSDPPSYRRDNDGTSADGTFLFAVEVDGTYKWRFTKVLDEYKLESQQEKEDEFPHFDGSWDLIHVDSDSVLLTFFCPATSFVCGGSAAPTVIPSSFPSSLPTIPFPTTSPSTNPTKTPLSSEPTVAPSGSPSVVPTGAPTSDAPTSKPSNSPSLSAPTVKPTVSPTNMPTSSPSFGPTYVPSLSDPSKSPSKEPVSSLPTRSPSTEPSKAPSTIPTGSPSDPPSVEPSGMPSRSPTSSRPTTRPTDQPSFQPTGTPTTAIPTNPPTPNNPTKTPSAIPTTPYPSQSPTSSTPSHHPTTTPSDFPSTSPSCIPSDSPSRTPSRVPSNGPSETPCIDVADLSEFLADSFSSCWELVSVDPACTLPVPGGTIADLCCYTCYLHSALTTAPPSCTTDESIFVNTNLILWSQPDLGCNELQLSPWPIVQNTLDLTQGGYADICDVPVIDGSSSFVPDAITEVALDTIGGEDMTIGELCPVQCLEECADYNPTVYYEFEGLCADEEGTPIAGYQTYRFAENDPICETFCSNSESCAAYANTIDRYCIVYGLELMVSDFDSSDREWSTIGDMDVDPSRGTDGDGTCFIKLRPTDTPSQAPIGTPSNVPSKSPSLSPLWTQCGPEEFAFLNSDLDFDFDCIKLFFDLTSDNFSQEQYGACTCIENWDEAVASKYLCSTPNFPQMSIYDVWERCELGLPTRSPSVNPSFKPSVSPDVGTCELSQVEEMTYGSSFEECQTLYIFEVANFAVDREDMCGCFELEVSVLYDCYFTIYPEESTGDLVRSCKNPTISPTAIPSPARPTETPVRSPTPEPTRRPNQIPSTSPSTVPIVQPTLAPVLPLCEDLSTFFFNYSSNSCIVLNLYIRLGSSWGENELCGCLATIDQEDTREMQCTVIEGNRNTMEDWWIECQG